MKYSYALLAAFFFSISVPLGKLLLERINPWQLSALSYLGCGIGLCLWLAAKNIKTKKTSPAKEAPLEKTDIPYIIGFIVSGGIIAPVLLFKGLSVASASLSSIALNFELVFTALIAFLFFKENISVKILFSVFFVVLGGSVLFFDFQGFSFSFNRGIFLVIGASLMWGLDNNFTAKVSIKNPVSIAAAKGIAGGLVNLGLSFYLVGFNLEFKLILMGLALGFVSYGISLVLLIISMRDLGASRAGILFGANPFMAALLSIMILKEPVTCQFVFAAIIMAIGIIFIFSEKHAHKHFHECLEHSHKHAHDEHHEHKHGGENKSSDIHSHKHVHEANEHSHEHLPDSHHKHRH